MKSVFSIIVFLLLVSCGKQEIKEEKKVVQDISKKEIFEQNPISFKRINFSIGGYSEDRRSKDFEITESDSIYYRTREDNRILENFAAKINSKDKQRIIGILDSLNFNVLKTGYEDEIHGVYYSLHVSFKNGELQINGPIPYDNQGKLIFNLLKLVEQQVFKQSKNRRFNTAKGVLLPQPPGQETSSLVVHDSL